MGNLLYTLLGEGEHLDGLHMSIRAFCMFFIALFLLRMGGMRVFGQRSAFDNTIAIMLGAVLARGVVGASPFGSTVAAGAVMICIHRILSWLSLRYQFVGKWVKGDAVPLYKNGQIIWRNMKKAAISEHDLMASLRQTMKVDSLVNIETAILERSGQISFIPKKEQGKT